MNVSSSKKVVLITGGSSGIGKSMGIYLSGKGYVVYGTSRNPERYKNFSSFKLIRLDVADTASIEEAVDYVLEEEGRVDVLINNAGVGITGPLEEIPREEMLKNFSTNYFGPIEVTKTVLPLMRKQGKGLVINITSIAGYMGLPYRGVYSASKAALEMTTEAWRMELKQFNINMVNVAPGDFATNIAAGRYHAPVIEGSPYQNQYQMSLKLMDDHVDNGKDPMEMAKIIHKIIENPSPKIHYKIGEFMQNFSIILKRILPDTWYERLLMNHYKL